MNSNYEWQKFAANNRVENYRRQAEAQRQSKQNAPKKENSSVMSTIGFAFAVGLVLFVIGFLLSGCQVATVPSAAAHSDNGREMNMAESEARSAEPPAGKAETGMSRAERIRFQDKREQLYAASTTSRAALTTADARKSLNMAEHIRFQDKREQYLAPAGASAAEEAVTAVSTGMSMAERIRFQDERDRRP